MRAVVFDAPKKVVVREVPDPVIGDPEDAIVRVTLAGICGTDLHVIAGDFPGLQRGATIGHEFVGEIVAVGERVQALRPGDHVMASDFTACGRCRWCAHGDHWQCGERQFFGTGSAFGSVLAGAQAEYVLVPHADTTLAKVPDGCSDEAAILIGDNLATGWVAIERANVRPGDVVAIIGGGAVGQLASLSAQVVGAGIVVVVEPNEERCRLARNNGAVACHPSKATQVIAQLTEGRGADVVVEAAGIASVLESAFEIAAACGRIVSVGAHTAATFPLPLAKSFSRELSLSFAIGDSIRLRQKLLSLVIPKVLDPTVVIDGRIGLLDAPDAYADLASQAKVKIVVDPRN